MLTYQEKFKTVKIANIQDILETENINELSMYKSNKI